MPRHHGADVDLRERGSFALHNGVPDNAGTGGEVALYGTGHAVDDAVRAAVVAAADYEPADHYVLFELRPTEVSRTTAATDRVAGDSARLAGCRRPTC